MREAGLESAKAAPAGVAVIPTVTDAHTVLAFGAERTEYPVWLLRARDDPNRIVDPSAATAVPMATAGTTATAATAATAVDDLANASFPTDNSPVAAAATPFGALGATAAPAIGAWSFDDP